MSVTVFERSNQVQEESYGHFIGSFGITLLFNNRRETRKPPYSLMNN